MEGAESDVCKDTSWQRRREVSPVFGSNSGLMCARDGAGREWVGMTAVALVGLQRASFLHGFAWLTELDWTWNPRIVSIGKAL